MMKSQFRLGAALCAVMVCAGLLQAQTQAPGQGQNPPPDQGAQQPPADQNPTPAPGPIPAYRSPLAGAAGSDDEDTTDVTPDTSSLTGVRNLSLGTLTSRSYWQPHVDVFTTVDSNPLENAGGGSNWGTSVSFSGGADVHQHSGASDLTLSYLGGGTVSSASNASTDGNGVVQGIDLSERLSFRRWIVTITDQLYYLPQSASGFNGLGGVSLPGGGGLGSVFTPGQTLLTGQGQSLDNSFFTEADLLLTPRSSLTFVGGYSLLHYFDSDLLNYGTDTFRVGYNYQIDRRNTLGLDYTFSEYNYSNFDQSITTHAVQLSYGRRVTGRLALQIAAGPEVALVHVPLSTTAGPAGAGETGTPLGGPTTQLYWTLNANLQYALARTSFGLAYNHGVGGGSGALAGSVTDTATGNITRQMSRTFSSGITGGYSRNSGTALTTTTSSNQTYDYWYGGANFTHPIGRSLGLTLAYQLQYQTSNDSFCIGLTCGRSVIRHMISLGVGWHERPLLF
jgi:hypothetical protein